MYNLIARKRTNCVVETRVEETFSKYLQHKEILIVTSEEHIPDSGLYARKLCTRRYTCANRGALLADALLLRIYNHSKSLNKFEDHNKNHFLNPFIFSSFDIYIERERERLMSISPQRPLATKLCISSRPRGSCS